MRVSPTAATERNWLLLLHYSPFSSFPALAAISSRLTLLLFVAPCPAAVCCARARASAAAENTNVSPATCRNGNIIILCIDVITRSCTRWRWPLSGAIYHAARPLQSLARAFSARTATFFEQSKINWIFAEGGTYFLLAAHSCDLLCVKRWRAPLSWSAFFLKGIFFNSN